MTKYLIIDLSITDTNIKDSAIIVHQNFIKRVCSLDDNIKMELTKPSPVTKYTAKYTTVNASSENNNQNIIKETRQIDYIRYRIDFNNYFLVDNLYEKITNDIVDILEDIKEQFQLDYDIREE